MDASRFDTFTRELTASRRSTLKSIVGVAAGLIFSSGVADDALAGCKKVGKKCDKSKDCCDGGKCKGGKNGKCRCKSGLDDCDGDGRCESLETDNANCGACGNACTAGEGCCDAACVDVQTDRANCGGCGVVCGAPEDCVSGSCLLCQPSAPLCGDSCCAFDNCCAGVCSDLLTSNVHCGACFVTCDFGKQCLGGECKVPI